MSEPSLFDPLPDEATARRTDPVTSREAAGSVRVRESQIAVWRLLRLHGPATDEELLAHATASGVLITPSGLRSRRSELARGGFARDTGERRLTESGRRSIVWEVAARPEVSD